MNSEMFQIEQKPIHEKIYGILKNAILNGDIRPGERLLQEDLANKFGVSRMPIRDALRLLETDKLIINTINKGATVVDFSSDELKDTFFVRSILEREAVKLAACNISDADIEELENLFVLMDNSIKMKDFSKLAKLNYEFHSVLYKKVSSKRLFEIIKILWDNFPRYAMLSTEQEALQSQEAHHKIIFALKNKDYENASTIMEKHILDAGTAYAARGKKVKEE